MNTTKDQNAADRSLTSPILLTHAGASAIAGITLTPPANARAELLSLNVDLITSPFVALRQVYIYATDGVRFDVIGFASVQQADSLTYSYVFGRHLDAQQAVGSLIVTVPLTKNYAIGQDYSWVIACDNPQIADDFSATAYYLLTNNEVTG